MQNVDLRNVHWNFGFHFNHLCMERWNNSQLASCWGDREGIIFLCCTISFILLLSLLLFSYSFSIHVKLRFAKLIWNLTREGIWKAKGQKMLPPFASVQLIPLLSLVAVRLAVVACPWDHASLSGKKLKLLSYEAFISKEPGNSMLSMVRYSYIVKRFSIGWEKQEQIQDHSFMSEKVKWCHIQQSWTKQMTDL